MLLRDKYQFWPTHCCRTNQPTHTSPKPKVCMCVQESECNGGHLLLAITRWWLKGRPKLGSRREINYIERAARTCWMSWQMPSVQAPICARRKKIIRHHPGANCALELLSGGQSMREPHIKILKAHSVGNLMHPNVDKLAPINYILYKPDYIFSHFLKTILSAQMQIN